MLIKNQLTEFLKPYIFKFENLVKDDLALWPKSSDLTMACDYSVSNGGRRFRPIILYLISKALNKHNEIPVIALSVEYFHTASLIADDLPAMDDDDFRRSKPSLHVKYGEATAILATYALISRGYSLINDSIDQYCRLFDILPNEAGEIYRLTIESISNTTGIMGATGGQFMDVFCREKNQHNLVEIIEKKTSALFEMAFFLGWIYGGGSLLKKDKVIAAASSFGRSFQILDDLKDVGSDVNSNNIVNELGDSCCRDIFFKEMDVFENSMRELSCFSEEFEKLSLIIKADFEYKYNKGRDHANC